jgi:hypothetical protein
LRKIHQREVEGEGEVWVADEGLGVGLQGHGRIWKGCWMRGARGEFGGWGGGCRCLWSGSC